MAHGWSAREVSHAALRSTTEVLRATKQRAQAWRSPPLHPAMSTHSCGRRATRSLTPTARSQSSDPSSSQLVSATGNLGRQHQNAEGYGRLRLNCWFERVVG